MSLDLSFDKYNIRKITDADLASVLNLYNSNPLYFKHCPPLPSIEGIRNDMAAVPKGISADKKHFIGIWGESNLIAVLDLIENFPNDRAAWIGLFIVDFELQGKGFGTKFINTLCLYLKSKGYELLQLAYVKDNPQAESFWMKNGFKLTGRKIINENYTAVVVEKLLEA